MNDQGHWHIYGATGVDMEPHCYRVHFGVDIEATGADMGATL